MVIQNKRILQILNLLNKNDKTITGKYLADSIGVSTRTIRNDIKEVEYFLKNNGAHIIAEPGSGYKLSIDDNDKYDIFINTHAINTSREYRGTNIVPADYNDRISFIIARILLNSLHNKIVKQEDLAEELFISLSTLKKYLGDIKKSIARFNLNLTTDRKNGIKIMGDETKIRYCISEYVFNRDDLLNLSNNQFFNDIFPHQEIETIKHILLKIILKYNIHLTDIAFKNLLVHIVITLRRSGKGNTVEYTKNERSKLQASQYYKPASEILNTVEKQLGIDIRNEIFYLTQHFIASQKFIVSAKKRSDFKKLLTDILNKIYKHTGIDLSDDSELVSGITIHLIAAISRLRFNMNIRNDILKSIKTNYPLAFDMAVIASEIIAQEEKVQTNENEIGFLAIHFGAALERNKLNDEMGKTAVIVCGAGLSTALLLKSKLQRRFGNILQIKKVMSCYELDEKIIKETDFIFTTVPITHIISKKIIRVEPIMTEYDLTRVEQKINEICTGDEIPLNNFFKKDLFIPLLKANSSKEVIEKITNKMLQLGFIDKNVKKSIFDREKLASTEFSNFIAIPHPLTNQMKNPAIAVAVLKNPIIWNKEKVQIIFLLSIPQNLYSVWESIFKKIYNNFIEGSSGEILLKTRSFTTLINELKY
ncbi:BglG family transcription antiterminator [Pectinatus frisingensis]|uniref:BglG family transcription antiterminator n=1 Tax=Pectinatus frisingensis TaxID=865 RepID=UPI0015F73AD6|nr:BglG family transcription antiterminator [Pectinatus frisingensis]